MVDVVLTRMPTAGNDTLTGTAGADGLAGYNGNDSLTGGGGDDLFFEGVFTWSGPSAGPFVTGSSYNTGLGNDSFFGGGGIDTLVYDGTNRGVTLDFATGEARRFGEIDLFQGIEVFVLTAMGDRVIQGANGVELYTLAGDDTVVGLGANVLLDAGDGLDLVDFGSGGRYAVANMGAGDDTVVGLAAGARIDGGEGVDVLDLGGLDRRVVFDLTTGDLALGTAHATVTGFDSIRGASFARNRMEGSSRSETLVGGTLDDTLIGGEGDRVGGGDGNDLLVSGGKFAYGGDGDDVLHLRHGFGYADAGNDTIHAAAADSNSWVYVFGGDGNDSLWLSELAAAADLGAGDDILHLARTDPNQTLLVKGGTGFDTLVVTETNAMFELLDGPDTVLAGTDLQVTGFEAIDTNGLGVSVGIHASGGTWEFLDGRNAVTLHGDGVTLRTGEGDDYVGLRGAGAHVETGGGRDAVAGGFDAVIDTGSGGDLVRIESGGATLSTGSGADRVFVFARELLADLGAGKDRVELRTGFDRIDMGAGDDRVLIVTHEAGFIWLGRGADLVVDRNWISQRMVIEDFDPAEDRIATGDGAGLDAVVSTEAVGDVLWVTLNRGRLGLRGLEADDLTDAMFVDANLL